MNGMTKLLLTSLTLHTLSACSSGGGDSASTEPVSRLAFNNISSSESISTNTGVVSSVMAATIPTQNLLLGFDLTGAEQEISNYSVSEYQTLSNGIYVVISETHFDENDIAIVSNTKYFVESSGNYHVINTIGSFIGESTQQLIVFSNVDTYDTKAYQLSRINTSLQDPTVRQLSGDFVLLYSGSGSSTIYQVFDIPTSIRYNVINTKILALSDIRLLISGGVMDIRDGSTSSAINDGFWNNESITEFNNIGGLLLSQSHNGIACTGHPQFCVYSVDETGLASLVVPQSFDTVYGDVGGNDPIVLFADSSYIIIKEITKISIIKRSDNSVSTVLNGLNVLTVTYKNGMIFFTAEDNLGNAKNGKHDIALDKTAFYENISELNKIRPL